MSSASDAPDVWQADDGTSWVFSAGLNIWTGWEPGVDGCWTLTPDEFRRQYPNGESRALMTERKPTVPEVAPLVEAFYALPGNGLGGGLHIVLEDNNVADSHVRWCVDSARQKGDGPAVVLGEILLKMSRTQRSKLFDMHGYPAEDPSAWHAALAEYQSAHGEPANGLDES